MPTPSAPSQLPFDAYKFDTAVLVNPLDLHNAYWNFINEFQLTVADLLNGQNGIWQSSACQVTASSGMNFTVAPGRGRALGGLSTVQIISGQAGTTGQPASFSFSIPNGTGIPNGQSRIDIVGLQYSWTNYTDADGFNHQVDTTSIATVQGTAAISPVAPTFPNNQYTQICTITVPSGATSASQCTIDNTKRTVLNDLVSLAQGFPTGAIIAYGGASAPAGWGMCDGGSISPVSTQQNLYNVTGTTFGGTPGTSFNRPNLNNGSIPLGTDQVTYLLGHLYGAATMTLSIANLPAHTHIDSGHTHGTTDNGHNHTQNSHGHSDSGHTHNNSLTDSGHYHNTAGWAISGYGIINPPTYFIMGSGGGYATTGNTNSATSGVSINNASGNASIASNTATNNANTTGITNNAASTGLTINNATPTNQSATTGLTVNSGSANNGNTGSGSSFSLLQPGVGVNYIIKY